MYEMEGPRLAPLPWSADCSATAGLVATTGFKIPPSVPVARPSGVPRLPRRRIPSSVVRDFYCLPRTQHKAFPRHLQDSFVIHRTSAVYPPCITGFHHSIHSYIHRLGESLVANHSAPVSPQAAGRARPGRGLPLSPAAHQRGHFVPAVPAIGQRPGGLLRPIERAHIAVSVTAAASASCSSPPTSHQ
jgi:hypothetical protein